LKVPGKAEIEKPCRSAFIWSGGTTCRIRRRGKGVTALGPEEKKKVQLFAGDGNLGKWAIDAQKKIARGRV